MLVEEPELDQCRQQPGDVALGDGDRTDPAAHEDQVPLLTIEAGHRLHRVDDRVEQGVHGVAVLDEVHDGAAPRCRGLGAGVLVGASARLADLGERALEERGRQVRQIADRVERLPLLDRGHPRGRGDGLAHGGVALGVVPRAGPPGAQAVERALSDDGGARQRHPRQFGDPATRGVEVRGLATGDQEVEHR